MEKQDFNIRINGEPFHCTHQVTVYNLLTYLDIDLTSNIVEYNHDILDLERSKKVFVEEHDEIEVITLVGGG
uniref:Thiamin biosynthesis protein S n=1 Tax=Neoizziella asiatica TaxID=1077397 RepID=A0A1G4NXN4_9FLOR|nr:Thiamin biosynthesis protein S [Neoizziella asiatica]SCW23276.1 Thiamin biosynthesis protein S [Neoizziella asiatica]